MCIGNLHFGGHFRHLDSPSGTEICVAVQFTDYIGPTNWTALVQPETWLTISEGAGDDEGPSPEEWAEWTVDALWIRGTIDDALVFTHRPEHPLHKAMHALEDYQTNPPLLRHPHEETEGFE